MRKILIIIIICFIRLSAFSQNSEEFVEVIVADTIQADPEEVIYTIYSYGDSAITEAIEKPSVKGANKEKLINKETIVDKIRAIIKKSAIDTLPPNLYAFQAEPYSRSFTNTFNLRFIAIEKLNSFLLLIQDLKGFTGFISEKRTSKLDVLKQILINRLLKKAAEDAAAIADHSKKQLGKLLQVKEEIIEESQGGWTVYPPLSMLAQSNYGNSSVKIIVGRKLIVRYSW